MKDVRLEYGLSIGERQAHLGLGSGAELGLGFRARVDFRVCWRVGFLVCCFPPCGVSPLRCLAGALCGSG